jgi:hypothetical protein
MGDRPYPYENDPTVDGIALDQFEKKFAEAAAEAALALGLVRVLTLLRFHDQALDEVEVHLASVWDSLVELRRLLTDRRRLGGDQRGEQR